MFQKLKSNSAKNNSISINYQPCLTNIIALIVMSISIMDVLQSVLNKSKIQCACLGAVFKMAIETDTLNTVKLIDVLWF